MARLCPTRIGRCGSTVAALLCAAAVLAGCGGSSASGSRSVTSAGTTRATHHVSRHLHHRPRHQRRGPRRPPTPDPGTLPQTSQLPHADARFHARMGELWRAIMTGSPHLAVPAFFPEAAYVQLKRVGDPASDFTGRLLADYALDIEAAHALLGAGAARARLIAVSVPSAYAHWVPPGVCDNGIGYYEVANSRIVYREGGVVRSFGIASLISWRGEWYVVHLGAILRPTGGGQVEDPEPGPGSSAPSSTC